MRLARPTVIVLALVVCAWFGLGFVQARDTDRATAIVSADGAFGPHQSAKAASLLRTAGTLNPDLEVQVLSGRLALRENNRRRAVVIFQHVARQEPMNLEPWIWLTRGATSAQVFAGALAAIGRLAPPVPRPK